MYRIAPIIPDPPLSLRQDCEMLTWLLGRIMRDRPSWTAEAAAVEVKRRVDAVTHVPWRLVGLVADSHACEQVPELSFEA